MQAQKPSLQREWMVFLDPRIAPQRHPKFLGYVTARTERQALEDAADLHPDMPGFLVFPGLTLQ